MFVNQKIVNQETSYFISYFAVRLYIFLFLVLQLFTMTNHKVLLSVSLLFLGFLTSFCYGAEIHDAAQKGNLNRVKELVEQGADINAKNKSGKTIIHSAAEKGSLDVVKFLVDQGADVNAKDNGGKTVLNFAVESGNEKLVEWLKEYGAK